MKSARGARPTVLMAPAPMRKASGSSVSFALLRIHMSARPAREAGRVVCIAAAAVMCGLWVRTERSRAIGDAVREARRLDAFRRLLLFHPLLECIQGVEAARPFAPGAMPHPRYHEQANRIGD